MDANTATGETPDGVESDNSKNAFMCAMCGKVEDFFDAQDAGWEIQENLEYICDECIAKKKATADDKKENATRKREQLINSIVSGEKNVINIDGYVYDVEFDLNCPEETVLVPHGSGSPAPSGMPCDDYRYTHGGKVFKKACDLADEIQNKRIEIAARDSDI